MNRSPVIALAALIAIAAFPAAGEPPNVEELQASARGLASGPLCSLALRVDVGETLDLVVPGASRDAGWGKVGLSTAALGTICLPDANRPERIDRGGDWSAGRLVATFRGGRTITLHASQMSAGIVVETSTDRVRLFAGTHERLLGRDPGGRRKLYGFPGQAKPIGPVTPAYAAVRDGEALRSSALAAGKALASPPGGWTVVYWADKTHFVRSDGPLAGRGRHGDAYPADCPLVLVFDVPPKAIRRADSGGLDFLFDRPGRRLGIFPAARTTLLPAAVTATWANAPPKGLAKALARRVAILRQYPLSARRSFRYDAAKDEAAFAERLGFLPIGTGGEKLTVLPPVVAVAMTRPSMAIRASGNRRGQALLTRFGPLTGTGGVASVTWTVGGLRRYVEPVVERRGDGNAPPGLAAELARHVAGTIEAGLLRPWCYADNMPINDTRGELYWAEPAEALYLLAAVHGALDARQRPRLVRYMEALRAAHPPATVASRPLDAGTPRGGYDPGASKAGQSIARERSGRVSIFALYGLERCLSLAGKKPDGPCWQACRKVLAEAFAEKNWATLYLLGHPNRRLPWVKASRAEEATPQWRGDRPTAVVNVNRTFAGAVGAIRLARTMNDAEAEQLGWRLLARSAVLRLAMGTLPAWRAKVGLAKIPDDPAWQWRLESGTWDGTLETPRWSRPGDDVRQVVGFGQDGPRYDDFGGSAGDLWQQRTTAQLVAFRYMVPELARFLRDHLKRETAELCRRVERNLPHWYASFSEAILGCEHNMNHPSDAFQLFLARAWVLDERPGQLALWIDVPWLARGDLFHMNKLAATIRAYGAVSPGSKAR